MEDADEGEKAARGVAVDVDLARQPLAQQRRALVVKAAPPHVDSLDLRWRGGLDGGVVAFANSEIVLHHAAKGSERKHHLADRQFILAANIKDEATFLDAQMEVIRPVIGASRCEAVLFDQIEDGDRTLMLDLRSAANDCAFVERHVRYAPVGVRSRIGQGKIPVAAGAVTPVPST